MAGLDDVQLHLVDSVDEASKFMTWLGERRPEDILSVDTETTGLDWTVDRIRLFQVGDAMTGWAIPWDEWRGVAYEFLRRWLGRLLFHNSKFDVMMLEMDPGTNLTPPLRLDWGRVDDTMLMVYALDHRLPKALKANAAIHVDPRAAALQARLDEALTRAGWTWETVPVSFGPYWQYGALDPVLTCRVHEVMGSRLLADDDARRAYDLELETTGVLRQMMQRGAAVDLEFASRKYDELWARVEMLRAWCQTNHDCLPGSTTKLAERLIELGAVLTERTDSGANWKTDKDVLRSVSIEVGGAAGQLADVALEAKQLTKVCNTYLRRFMSDAIDGRVHPDINVVGAEKTTRMSMTGPGDKAMPLHQLPRRDGSNAASIAARDCFIPSEGNMLVMIDYEQIEWRLIGHFSQDPALLEVLRDTSTDPFLAMCRQIYNDPTILKKDHRRQMTKNAAYAKGYGAAAAKFSLTAGVPLSVGGPFYDAFDATYPTLKTFQEGVIQIGKQRRFTDGDAWVRTPFGHKLSCEPGKEYTLVNRLIQGTAASVLKKKLCELDNAGLAEYAILPVHDEVVFDFPMQEARDMAYEAGRVMDASELFSVPMPVGIDGPYDRWGDKYR